MPRLVAAAAMVAHLAFLAFLLVGGLRRVVGALGAGRPTWRRRRGACGSWSAPSLPADRDRELGPGAFRPSAARRGGFIAHYLEGRLYPDGRARGVEIVAGALVLVSWIGLALR